MLPHGQRHEVFLVSLGSGEYPAANSIHEHTLNIADLWVALIELDRAGTIKLLPESGVEYTVAGLRADIYVDVALPAIGKRRRFFVEVQRNARKDLIRQKVEAHWTAFQTATERNWPRVAFVSMDDYIVDRIKRQIPADKKELFDTFSPDEFLSAVTETPDTPQSLPA